MLELLVRYLHFISIISLASMLVVENVLIAKRLKMASLKTLVAIDGFYGLSAVAVFITGLLLWLAVGKPSAFYSSNPIFHAKLGLFVVVALLSAFPTIFILKNRRAEGEEISVPSGVILIKRLEVGLLLILPFLAVLMARGYGISN